jgi:hypothetical protein
MFPLTICWEGKIVLKSPPVKPTIHPIQATFYEPDATMNTSHATLSVREGKRKIDKPVISLILLSCLSTSMLYYPSIKLVDIRGT